MKDGGPAFPSYVILLPAAASREEANDIAKQMASLQPKSMRLRDYFAGQALIGELNGGFTPDTPDDQEFIARQAFQVADAMLKEREKENAE